MTGKWAECATGTENGTISVQQVFETWPSLEHMVSQSRSVGPTLG